MVAYHKLKVMMTNNSEAALPSVGIAVIVITVHMNPFKALKLYITHFLKVMLLVWLLKGGPAYCNLT